MKSYTPQHSTISKILFSLLFPVNRFFDRLYHSKYNPMYRSGAIAAAMLCVLMVTGVYLLFFYQISSPYESLENIQHNAFLGKWVRAIHRYATDITMIAVVVHILQLISQGRTWGPRVLAWLSGVLLLLAIFVSAWTGYVMIWDSHGQLLAMSGASMLQSLSFLKDVIAPAFDGSTNMPSSFFFMNMFLHIAIPLGMVMIMWVHTCKLTGNMWFPIKAIFIWSLIAVAVFSLVWPAPMLKGADLLNLTGIVPTDLFYGFWIPIVSSFSAEASLVFFILLFIFLLSFPLWCKPKLKDQLPKSEVKDDDCIGCNQCMHDCPFEAISMIPREDNHQNLAVVDKNSCVSCGICATSCPTLAVGPPGRNGHALLERARNFISSVNLKDSTKPSILLAACTRNPGTISVLEALKKNDERYAVYPVNCSGTIHTDELEILLSKFDGVFVWNCTVRNCVNRRGGQLLLERIYSRRQPFLPREIKPTRIHIHPASVSEVDEVKKTLLRFEAEIAKDNGITISPYEKTSARYLVTRVLATLAILLLIGFFTRYPLGSDPDFGILRISARLPGRAKSECRPLTAVEIKSLPKHMQQQEICETKFLSYRLIMNINGESKINTLISPGGVRGDRPLYVSEELKLKPGNYTAEVLLSPEEKGDFKATSLSYQSEISIKAGRVFLLNNHHETEQLAKKD
ncbi:MAG: 4Fe-4S binding protein [Bdellovibrionota bacterium]